MEQRVVTIVGGTGFVGRYAVKLLAEQGYTIRVISRHPDAALHLKTSGNIGEIVLMAGDLAQPDSLNGKLEGSYAVINLTGILFESGRQKFTAIHASGAEKLAQMAKAAGVERFIHLSALGVDKAAGSLYARSKLLGENAVLTAFPQAAILRPSVIFGPEDNFFNQFATMANLLPYLPNIGGGHAKFQPVYVGDIARAISACLTHSDAMGRIYELGGPHVFTFEEILQYTFVAMGREKPGTISFARLLLYKLLLLTPFIFTGKKLADIPFGVASAIGFLCETPLLCIPFDIISSVAGLPRPLLTRDQVRLLKYDNTVTPNAPGFAQLGISPAAVEVIVPEYLARFSKKAVI